MSRVVVTVIMFCVVATNLTLIVACSIVAVHDDDRSMRVFSGLTAIANLLLFFVNFDTLRSLGHRSRANFPKDSDERNCP